MMSKIRNYIENAFLGVNDTKKTRELKDELYANLIEKYNDQLESGKSETESYTIAIASIGEIDELVESLKIQSPLKEVSQSERKKSAMLVSIAVMLYIISPFILITFAELFKQEIIGLGLMFVAIAAATGILIYNNMTKPRYERINDTMVEEFKEYVGHKSRKDKAYHSFKSGFWGLVVAAYLLSSFIFGIWAYSWLIFIVAAAIENIVKGVFDLRGNDDERKY